MKRPFLLLMAALVLAAPAFAADKPKAPAAAAAKNPEAAVAKSKQYEIRLTNGGIIHTDNYVIEGGKVKVNLPAGAISVNRAMVKSIREVSEEGATVQEMLKPSAPAMPPASRPGASRDSRPSRVAPPIPEERPDYQVPADNEGRPESWWKRRVAEWKNKLADAEKRYQKATAAWNQYNGVVQGMGSSTTEFDQLKYQDLRGAARTEMDQAQADIDEAKRMLEQALPDEARKAGAPPGWAR